MPRHALAFVFLALTACAPAAEPEKEAAGAATIPTPRNPFFGVWTMADVQVAPWWDRKGAEPAADPAFARISFAASQSSGPPMLTCDKPRYTVNIAPVRSLFEGKLADPDKNAPALGFTAPDVTVMSFDCTSAPNDLALDFPMIDDKTIMFGLDNVLYTFKRTDD